MYKKKVLINAIAAKSSGALSILKDFINYIYNYTDPNIEYYLFTVVDDFVSMKGFHVVLLPRKGWLSRIQWDEGGLEKWCKKKSIIPDCIISLQNTSTKWAKDKIPQVVYYHQPLPLVNYKFNLLDKNEFLLFLYQKFYFFFVNRNNYNTTYIVQLPYIKDLLNKKLNRNNKNSIFVVTPNTPHVQLISKKSSNDKFTFLYPATPLRYKNHKIIIDALVRLVNINSPVLSNIRIIFTIDSLSQQIQNKIKEYNLSSVIRFIGKKPYHELLDIYAKVDAVLFPSQIESYGLPLIEAASFGLPIIASDLIYAHEVLPDYDNILFIDPENEILWADAISDYRNLNKTKPLIRNNSNSWGEVINISLSLINK